MRLTCCESEIGRTVGSPDDAVRVMLPMMLADRETFVVTCLDADRRVIVAFVAAVGTATQVSFEPKEIFRTVLMLGATHILIAHNHPDGNPTPSDADLVTTQIIEVGCKILGINYIDHLVLTNSGKYRSIAEYMELHQ